MLRSSYALCGEMKEKIGVVYTKANRIEEDKNPIAITANKRLSFEI